MSTNDTERRNQVRAEIRECNNKVGQLRRKNADYLAKIARLEAAYKKISSQKTKIKSLRNKLKKTINNDHYKWEGDNYKVFKRNGKTLIKDLDAYKSELDIAHDKINRKKAKYEGKVLENNGLIGQYLSAVNQLHTELQNVFN